MIGLSVDDGPVSEPTASPRLYDFLKEQNQTITHFMIGGNIRDNPKVFLRAFEELDHDIGVHTWSHPYMTTLTNEKIVAEIGWTLQIIHDSTGGRIPRYWRPPYGDADNRVRAIASEVFGLTSVIWNRDTADWSLSSGGTTLEKIQAQFKEWLEGPRSPGLMILEHEIEGGDVTAFINALPLIRQHKEWTAVSVARLFDSQPNGTWYLNAQNNTSPVTPMNVGAKNKAATPPSNASSAASSASSSAASSAASSASSAASSAASSSSPPSDAATTTGGGATTSAGTQAPSTPPANGATPTDVPAAADPPATPGAPPPADTEVPADPPAAGNGNGNGNPTSTTVVVVTRPSATNAPGATNAPNANNAVAQPNAAGAAIDVPSHLGLSALITVLSVLGGSALL